eukprot:m51a1_g10826 putative 3 5 -cyclic nucleotide phosphodiesterase (1028) ;mRNA; f:17457-21743
MRSAAAYTAALIALLGAQTGLSGELPWMEVVVLGATSTTTQIVAAQIEKLLSEGHLGTSAHLTDLTYVPGLSPGLVDRRTDRPFEFHLGNVSYDGDDEDPTLNASIGGSCGCRAEWEALCNASQKALNGSRCLTCARACEGLLFLRTASALTPVIAGLEPYNPYVEGWLLIRSWRADAEHRTGRDFMCVFSELTSSFAPVGRTLYNSSKLNTGSPLLAMVPVTATVDRTPVWTKPYYLRVRDMDMVSCGVRVWTPHGEYLGLFFLDLAMSQAKAMFLNLTVSTKVPVQVVMAQSSGAVVAAPESTVASLWGSCPNHLCNVFNLSADMERISQMDLGYSEYVEVVIGGMDYIVFAQTLRLGWKLWFFCLHSDAFPRKRVHELEDTLGSVASANVIGTPAEDAIKMLLEVQKKAKMPRELKGEMNKVVALIATNKLFKADSNLREKLLQFHLESEVNDFLVGVLATETQKNTGERMETLSSRQMSGLISFRVCQELDAVAVVKNAGDICSWDFDVESVQLPPGATLLEVVGMAILESEGLITELGLDYRYVQTFLRSIEAQYKDNPYHNARHAADVAQATYALVKGCTAAQFTPLERLAAVVAAVIHDVGHPGVNNAFLQSTMDALHVRYNGASVLESMHSAEGMRVLLSDECNFVRGKLPQADVVELHRTVASMVLATDMSRHLEFTSQLLMLQLILKAADVSNSSRRWEVCGRWARRVMEEFGQQGDQERERGLTVSAFMDRGTQDIARCQTAFIKYVMLPMADIVAKISPAIGRQMSDNLIANSGRWAEEPTANGACEGGEAYDATSPAYSWDKLRIYNTNGDSRTLCAATSPSQMTEATWAMLFTPPEVPWRFDSVCMQLVGLSTVANASSLSPAQRAAAVFDVQGEIAIWSAWPDRQSNVLRPTEKRASYPFRASWPMAETLQPYWVTVNLTQSSLPMIAWEKGVYVGVTYWSCRKVAISTLKDPNRPVRLVWAADNYVWVQVYGLAEVKGTIRAIVLRAKGHKHDWSAISSNHFALVLTSTSQ